MLLEAHVVLCVTEADFWRKKYFGPKRGKVGQKQVKNRVFEFIGKFSH